MQISAKRRTFASVIELERHIEILLLTNDCVIVPGLGGFMAHHCEAHYDDGEKLFLPPLRTIGFNPQLKLNDSLLAQSYVEAYDISYPEAIRKIEEEVAELKQNLHNNGEYELNDIGILRINEENNYSFEPCEAGVLSPYLYGLDSIEIGKLDADVQVYAEQETDLPARESIQDDIQQPADVEEDAENDGSTIKIKIAWLRNAVAIAASFIAFFFITTPISNSNSSYITGEMKGNMLQQIMQPAGSEHIDTIPSEQIKKAIAANDSAATAKAVPDSAVRVKAKPSFCIVLASRITKKNAAAYIDELHENGYEQAHLYINNDIVRVVYGDYGSEAEAYSTLRTIRGNKYFEQAWILTKK